MSVIPLKVVVRARPLIQKEIDEGCQTCLNFIPYEPQIILGKDRSFTYDFVFRPTDPQISVYEDAVKPLIQHIFKGYNSTVLAYGQTGSGKTFTMGGGYEDSLKMDPDGMGIIPRIVQEIFNTISEKENYKFKVAVSYLEIINEDLQDLLVNNKKDSLTIREENGVIKLPGLREVPVSNTEETMKYLEQGCNNRTTAATAMNNTSSRSHAIFSVYIEQQHEEDINDFWKVKLQLVDLAGSERVKKTHAEGARLKEGININKGLLALGNVISILGDETKKILHVPYRDSKLTRILQDSLGGNSHTLMIACVSPADSNMEESLNTLRYADRARKIKNKPVVNWDPQTAEIMRLKGQVQQLTMKLINAGLTELDSESDLNIVKPDSPTREKDAQALQKWIDKCKELEEEVINLHKELRISVDQAATMGEKALRWEMKCERLKSRLKELESNIGVDFDLLSSSIVDENNPALAEQLEKLKALASKLNDSVSTENTAESSEDEENAETEAEEGQDEMPCTPESREMLKQHTLRRARMNNQLTELNKILETKEKLANKFIQNDTKMVEMQAKYEQDMKNLEVEISSLQKEKENLSTALEDAKTNVAASKLSEQRRKRLQELEGQMGDLKKKLVEQKKMLKVKDQSEKQVTQLNTEIQGLKTQRVKLMKQMKEDNDQWRKWRQKKDKEVLQLQQKDRKRQFEIQKLQRENKRTQNVLHRKSEEAAAANRRLKEALAKQKQVIEERNQKFEKCDKNAIGNRVRKWLSFELDVKVGIMEAKYHRESLLQDRKMLAEQLKELKESLNDDAPPSKKMAWMDDSGKKHETSFEEEETKKKVHHLQQQIELRNVQIADLQQKIFDAEQEGKGKSTKDNLHTMMEAKIALKWLLDQSVSFKADNNRIRLEMEEMKHSVSDRNNDNDEILSELEEKIEQLKKKYERDITRLQSDHQQEIEILLASSANVATTSTDLKDELKSQKKEIDDLKKQLKKKTVEYNKMEKHLTKYMYQDKKVALMPELTDDESEIAEPKSPFLAMRPKSTAAGRSVFGLIQTDESIRSSDEFEKPPRPPMRKSVSAGMLASKKSTRSSSKFKGDNEGAKKTLKKKGSKSDLKVDEDDDDEIDEAHLRKLRKRSSRFDLKQILAEEKEKMEELPPKKTRALRKKSSKTDLAQIDTSNEENVVVTRGLSKRSSKTNLNETFTSEENEKSSLNETFTTSQEDDDSQDLMDGGLKKKRKLFNVKESFFSPVEFADSNV
ncbi:chromosome-associated kinesin KIF4-like [Ruditapes philippinarum]|uniref:chromosome-associated kinesin KIF4-like n=1 Tax=Ruditapes philippinarum TaxID=129788 RepID=UPI00295A75B7|nr:chromosome-associated kinesin KIF4-like [Ruditapes philippinarum]XP_060598857.1 chromosome-associated kinesin KIF4-like [Ruditapes philippinarum]